MRCREFDVSLLNVIVPGFGNTLAPLGGREEKCMPENARLGRDSQGPNGATKAKKENLC